MSIMQKRREEKAAIQTELESMLKKVPPSYSDWSWDRTHSFIEAQKVAARAKSMPKMQEAVRALRSFWQ